MDDTTEPEAQDINALFMAPEAQEAPEEAAEEPEQETPDDAPEDDGQDDDLGEDEAEDEDPPEDDADEEDEGEDQPQLFRVKVDGEEVDVTLDELRNGYAGQAYIRKGMQEAAQTKKQAVEAFQALQQSQQQLSSLMEQIQQGGLMKPPQPPTEEMATKNPVGFNIALAKYHNDLARYQQQSQQITQMRAQQTAAQEAAMQAHIEEQSRLLLERIPDLADPEKAATTTAMLKRAATDYGYSSDEIDGIDDARALQVLHDAAKYRALKSGKATAKTREKSPSRTVKPKARRAEPPHLARARQISQAKKTGDADAVLGLFLEPKG